MGTARVFYICMTLSILLPVRKFFFVNKMKKRDMQKRATEKNGGKLAGRKEKKDFSSRLILIMKLIKS